MSASILDISPDEILNSDSVNQMATAQAAATETQPVKHGDPELASVPAKEDSGPVDSGVFEAALQQVMAEPVEKTETAAPETAEVTPQTDSGSGKPRGAAARIQQLISERDRLMQTWQSERVAFQTQMAQERQALLEMQKSQMEYQKSLEERRLAAEEARQRALEEASLSDVEKARRAFKRETETEAMSKLKAEVMPEIQSLKAALEQERIEKAQARQAAEQQARLSYFKNQAERVLSEDLLKGYAPEDAKALQGEMEEMLYAYAGAFGIDPSRAAPAFKTFLQKAFKAEAKRLSSSAAKTGAQSVPQSVPAGKSVPTTTKMPTLAALKAKGIDNHVEWMKRGRPAV